MTYADMLNWLQDHLKGLNQTFRDDLPFEMIWIDDEGTERGTFGTGLMDCIAKAVMTYGK